jgi:hypothetical protein
MNSLKILLILIFLLEITNLQGQNKFYVTPVVGVRIRSNNLPAGSFPGKTIWYTDHILGVEIGKKNKPLSVSFQKTINLEFLPFLTSEISYDRSYLIHQYWTEDNILLNYNFGKGLQANLGYFYMFRENLLSLVSNAFGKKYNGLLYGINKNFDYFNIGIRSKLVFKPFSFIVGDDLYSLNFTTNFRSNHYSKLGKKFGFEKNLTVKATAGTRIFHPTGDTLIYNEEYPKVGFMPTFGLEFYIEKLHLSFNIEKDFWINVNGGSPIRDVKGMISGNFLALKYHHKLKNERYLRFGVGYSYLRDLEQFRYVTYEKYNKFARYHLKGIGLSTSYQVFENADIEIKHTLPFARLNEPFFNPKRLSLGVIWRLYKHEKERN